MFQLRINPSEKMLADLKAKAAAGGVRFSGDLNSGSFSSNAPAVAGKYTVKDGVVTVVITQKPWLVPEAVIATRVKGYFGV